jgi:hypothetical protein
MLEVSSVDLLWRRLGAGAWQAVPLSLVGRRTFACDFCMPSGVETVEYKVQATFASSPTPVVLTAPPAGGATSYVISQ